MTVGGSKTIPNTKRFVKLYSLSGDLAVPTCLQNLANLPDNRQYSAGATLGSGLCKWDYRWVQGSAKEWSLGLSILDGIPYICGGAQQTNNKNCLRYNPSDDSWVKSGDLKYEHYKSGYTSHSTLGLVICGQERNTDSQKCETTLDGNVIQGATKSCPKILNFTTVILKFPGFYWLTKCNEFSLSSGAR